MIEPSRLFEELANAGVTYYAGVPDSLLKFFCAYVSDNVAPENHVITANEGASVGLAIGYHLATGDVPLVYMQNSGLGNTINPLMSLADSDVYSIPMVLMIGWRGEPDTKDEPQHVKQGKVTLTTLDAMGIPYEILDGEEESDLGKVSRAVDSTKQNSSPVALVVKKGSFASYKLKNDKDLDLKHKREDAIKIVADCLSDDHVVVSTTGMASRELFEYRKEKGQDHSRDFLTVGGMGHANQIAMGIAAQKGDREVVCIDGDGAILMHMGSLAICGQSGLKNFTHIVVNNAAHDSVGGQPTVANEIDLTAVARACGYTFAKSCDDLSEFKELLKESLEEPGVNLLEVKVGKGNRADLGRPTTTPKENKNSFMSNLENWSCK